MTILCTYDFSSERLRYAYSRDVYTVEQLNAEHFSKTKANKLITQLSGGRAFYETVDPSGLALMAYDLACRHSATVFVCLPPTGWSAINSEVFA